MVTRSPSSPRTAGILCLLTMLAVSACAAEHPKGQADLLAFLHDGATTKEEVKSKLGYASIWLNGSLWTYRLGQGTDGLYLSPHWKYWTDTRYSLVLEFGPDGILRRHGLVNVERPP